VKPRPPEPQPVKTRDDVRVVANRCPYCRDDVAIDGEDWVGCHTCLARHHAPCWSELGRCGACGEERFLESQAPATTTPPAAHAAPPETVTVTLPRTAPLVAQILAGLVVVVTLALFVQWLLTYQGSGGNGPWSPAQQAVNDIGLDSNAGPHGGVAFDPLWTWEGNEQAAPVIWEIATRDGSGPGLVPGLDRLISINGDPVLGEQQERAFRRLTSSRVVVIRHLRPTDDGGYRELETVYRRYEGYPLEHVETKVVAELSGRSE
jgi:hypothetical protein